MATFPEKRVEEQMLRGALLVFLERRQLPEVLTLVLHPRGQYRVPTTQTVQSPLGLTGLSLTWRVVELWTLPAAQLLAANDVGPDPVGAADAVRRPAGGPPATVPGAD